jgi:hypothetical protein
LIVQRLAEIPERPAGEPVRRGEPRRAQACHLGEQQVVIGPQAADGFFTRNDGHGRSQPWRRPAGRAG